MTARSRKKNDGSPDRESNSFFLAQRSIVACWFPMLRLTWPQWYPILWDVSTVRDTVMFLTNERLTTRSANSVLAITELTLANKGWFPAVPIAHLALEGLIWSLIVSVKYICMSSGWCVIGFGTNAGMTRRTQMDSPNELGTSHPVHSSFWEAANSFLLDSHEINM